MKYFRSKKYIDNLRKYKIKEDILVIVEDELFTIEEVIENNIPLKLLEEISVEEIDTYYSFGARFSVHD